MRSPQLSTPVMVCMDGFVLTHAFERVDVPARDEVDAFLPAYEPRQVLDPADPVSMGAMVGPEAFTEVRYLAHMRQLDALTVVPSVAAAFADRFGRTSGGLVRPYRTEDAETVVVALGSVLGTLKDTVDELRAEGVPIGVVGITTFRPFPYDALRAAVGGAARIIVLERAFSVGTGGIVTADVRAALTDRDLHTVVAGLGGRPVTEASLHALLLRDDLGPLTFLDLNTDLVERELGRRRESPRSGPTAENLLRDLDRIGES